MTGGYPIGHFVGVLCDWTTYDAQIVKSLDLGLQVQNYAYGEVLQILQASEVIGAGILFYWWEPSGVAAREVGRTQPGVALGGSQCIPSTSVQLSRGGRYSRLSLPPSNDVCEAARDPVAARCAGNVSSGARRFL